MVRILENKDWIIYSIIAIIVLYIFTSRVINKGLSLTDFLFLPKENTGNLYVNYSLISLAYVFILSVFLSPHLPIIPQWVAEHVVFQGYTLNKLGFTFLSFSLFYLSKCLLSYLFFKSSFSIKNWNWFVFKLNKFYGVLVALFTLLTIFEYFTPLTTHISLTHYLGILIIILLAKVMLLLFNRDPVFPNGWYYKFLYICTLQITPYLAIVKFLFF